MNTLDIQTEQGTFTATYSDRGLAALNFPSPRRITPLTNGVSANARKWHELTTEAVARALRGEPLKQLPPLDLSDATDFQKRVWAVLQNIPKGEALTYSQVARAIGKPKAVRAVGGACGANPIPLLIPCHRVVASGGLGGFSGGLHWKRALLDREGIRWAEC